jgi:hypothetical protein
MSHVPTNVGTVYDANGNTNTIKVVNFGTTVYTGPVDVSLTLARIRALKCETQEANDGGFFNPTGTEVPQVIRHPENANYYMEFVVWYAINTNAWTYDTGNLPYPGVTWPGPMRLLIGAGGEVYFTGDHYVTAQWVNPPPQLGVSPSTGLTSSGNVGGPFSPSSQVYALTNSGFTAFNWTATKNVNWLTVSPSSGTLAAGAVANVTLSINANATNLTANSYSATVGFTNTANDVGDTTRTVSLTVNAAPSGTLVVTPLLGLTSSGSVGGPFNPSSQVYALTNSGGASLNWTASNTANWLSLSPVSGTLAAGAATTVTVSINANATNLSANSYSDTVGFTNTTNGAGNTTRPASLTVTNVVSIPFQSWQNFYWATGASDPNAAPDLDPYGKGISNTNQFLAGFNPTNTTAYPQIISIAVTGDNVNVTYLGSNGDTNYPGGPTKRTNVLEFTTGALDGSVSNNFTSTGQTNILSDGNGSGIVTNMVDGGGATNIPSRYYRVRILAP